MKNEHEIQPLEGGLVDGVAFRKQLRELKCDIDAAIGPSRTYIKTVMYSKRKVSEEEMRRMCNTVSQPRPRKHVESRVIEKPEPKQIEGEKDG